MPDEPSVGAPEPEAPAGADAPAGAGTTVGDAVRVVAFGASIGAAVIHFALAPVHLDERTSDGVFFLVVAWLQVAAALALLRWRRRPEPWLAAAAVNGGVALVWLGSRTVGVPESHHTSIGLPDSLAAALEVTVVLSAVVALRGALARRPVPRAHPLAAGVVGVALAGLVSASVTPSLAGEAAGHDDHAAGAHGDDHGDMAGMEGMDHGHGDAEAAAQVPLEDRCDLGFNTPGYNEVAAPGAPHHTGTGEVDFTIEEWAEVFIEPTAGLTVDVAVDFINDNEIMREAILMGEVAHTLDPEPWNPLTEEGDCEQLASELAEARQVAADHPTVADAVADGYEKVTDYLPGIGAHYLNRDYVDGEFEASRPEMLLYDNHTDDAHVVGLSYFLMHEGEDEPADGFTGENDHYHRHTGLCIRDGVVVAGSNVTDAQCAAVGGEKGDGTGGWMSHVWVVPGCESDWGVFSGANANLTVRMDGSTRDSGCGTGQTMDSPLAFESDARGPGV